MKIISRHAFHSTKVRYHKRYKLLASYVPELIAMRTGLRKAIQLSLPLNRELDANRMQLKVFCDKVGFFLHEYEEAGACKLIASAVPVEPIDERTGSREHVLGRYFAYPDCCIEGFTKRENLCEPLINNIADLLEGSESFPFTMNPFLRTSPFHLYKHFPCSLTCEKTQKEALLLLSAIEKENPELHRLVVRFNHAPVLFTDITGIGILFEGKKSENRIDYSGWYHDYEPASMLPLSRHNKPEDCTLFDTLIESINQGNGLELKGSKLVVWRNNMIIGSFHQPEHLSWRIIEFI